MLRCVMKIRKPAMQLGDWVRDAFRGEENFENLNVRYITYRNIIKKE